jgi:hypothetical protein
MKKQPSCQISPHKPVELLHHSAESPPLRLHQATVSCWTHAQWDPHLSGHARSTLHWDTCPQAVPAFSPESDRRDVRIPYPRTHHQIHDHQEPHPLSRARPQPRAGPTACQDTHPLCTWFFRPCWTPAMEGMTRAPHLRLPTHQALPGSSSVWNDWSPAPLGQAQAWRETGASSSQEHCLFGGDDPSSTGFPENHSTRLPLWLPLEGAKHA